VRLYYRSGFVLRDGALEFFYSSFQRGDVVGLGRHMIVCVGKTMAMDRMRA